MEKQSFLMFFGEFWKLNKNPKLDVLPASSVKTGFCFMINKAIFRWLVKIIILFFSEKDDRSEKKDDHPIFLFVESYLFVKSQEIHPNPKENLNIKNKPKNKNSQSQKLDLKKKQNKNIPHKTSFQGKKKQNPE